MTTAAPFPERAFDDEPWPAYVIDAGGIIVRVNWAWDREAQAAGGPRSGEVLGTRWLDWIHGDELRAWHADLLARLLGSPYAPGQGGVVQTCECNTSMRYRVFTMRFSPLTTHRVREPSGVLVITTLIAEGLIEAHYRVGVPDPARYRDAQGVLRQCSGCRRVHVPGVEPPSWEIAPALVATPVPDVSHGICELCWERYYSGLARRARAKGRT